MTIAREKESDQVISGEVDQISLVPKMLKLIEDLYVISFDGEALSFTHNVLLDELDPEVIYR